MAYEGRVLGLDVGARRIGVAQSDPLGITAQAKGFIEQKGAASFQEIANWVSRERVIRVVVGLPLNMNGSQGPQADGALKFKEGLQSLLKIPVETWDERLTTRQAESVLIEANVSRNKRKGKVDALSAQMILQSYLDAHRRNA